MKSAIAQRLSARVGPGVLLLLIVSLAQATQSAADEKEHVAAVWKTQEINFHYQSFTTYYTCQALEDRVTRVLTALGVARDLNVRAGGCESGRIAAMPFVRIRITSPVEATPQVLAELEASRSKRELTARVRGEPLPDVAEQFPAYWRPVSIFKGRLKLDAGDCALAEQMQRHLFPKLAIRVVKDRVDCSPNQFTLGQAQLDIEVLAEVPRVAADAPAAPAAQPEGKQP